LIYFPEGEIKQRSLKPLIHNVESDDNFFLPTLLVISSVFFVLPSYAQKGWPTFFNGKNLDGWEVRQGTAEYKAEGNEIIGISKFGSRSTYMCTKKRYSDFILEADVKIEPGINSGIQIRSIFNEHVRNGAVQGYQAEISSSADGWSGGIFDQSRRNWIYPLTRNEAALGALKYGEWNRYHIEAIGNTIRTWVNGIPCANLVDDMTLEGFIGLQVHAIKNKEQEGLTVRWRDLKIMTDNLGG